MRRYSPGSGEKKNPIPYSPLTYTAAGEDEGLKLIDVLVRRMAMSGRSVRRAKQNNLVALNGVAGSVNRRVREGDVIDVHFLREENIFEPENIRIDILYEDEDLIVVDKPPFLVVHPTKGHPAGTLGNALAYHQQKNGENGKIRFINRLDRDTSGIVLIAKNANAQQRIAKQMKAGTVGKRYTALVEGRTEPSGAVDAPIDRLTPEDVRRGVAETGLPSRTEYRTIEVIRCAVPVRPPAGPENSKENGSPEAAAPPRSAEVRPDEPSEYSLIDVDLLTGRTHQIRVHMAHIGHPVVGDSLYGRTSPWIDRQALHCRSMAFLHPRTGREMIFEAPLPGDIRDALRMLRFQAPSGI